MIFYFSQQRGQKKESSRQILRYFNFHKIEVRKKRRLVTATTTLQLDTEYKN